MLACVCCARMHCLTSGGVHGISCLLIQAERQGPPTGASETCFWTNESPAFFQGRVTQLSTSRMYRAVPTIRDITVCWHVFTKIVLCGSLHLFSTSFPDTGLVCPLYQKRVRVFCLWCKRAICDLQLMIHGTLSVVWRVSWRNGPPVLWSSHVSGTELLLHSGRSWKLTYAGSKSAPKRLSKPLTHVGQKWKGKFRN